MPLRRRQPDGHPYDTRFKMLYSNTGLYFLMDGTDRKLTATMNEDFMDLWNEDVFEVFLWTDERYPVYFEYEISPLNRELPILVPNFGGQFLGWRPWHYEKDRLTRKATSVTGGQRRRTPRSRAGARSSSSLRAAEAAAERAAEAGHALARQLLSHGLRRREAHAVGVGAGRRELPRVREVRRSGVRGSLRDNGAPCLRALVAGGWEVSDVEPQTFSRGACRVPLVGNARRSSGRRGARRRQRHGRRDYFRELGVRPFINAPGTYTAMTASLMPPEVMEAINYASKHYVMLDELHDKVGERIATLVQRAAMVTSGARRR